MRPPTNRILRALWAAGQCADLTTVERVALFALWAMNGHDAKPIGPTLLAHLTGIANKTAKQVLWRLAQKGYVVANGGGGRGLVATRRITNKAKLPGRKQSTDNDRLRKSRKPKGSTDGFVKGQQGMTLTSGQDSTALRLVPPSAVQSEKQIDGRRLTAEEVAAGAWNGKEAASA